MPFQLFPKREKENMKDNKKEKEDLEEKQKITLIRLAQSYLKRGYTLGQIKKVFISKGYPIEVLNTFDTDTEKKEVKMVNKKQEYEEEEFEEEPEETEEEEEEEEEEEFEAPLPKSKPQPQSAQKEKVKIKTPEKAEKTEEKTDIIGELIQAITGLNTRLAVVESALFRAGVR